MIFFFIIGLLSENDLINTLLDLTYRVEVHDLSNSRTKTVHREEMLYNETENRIGRFISDAKVSTIRSSTARYQLLLVGIC